VLQVDCTHYSVHVHRGVKKKPIGKIMYHLRSW
jgi:hypothetical protein